MGRNAGGLCRLPLATCPLHAQHLWALRNPGDEHTISTNTEQTLGPVQQPCSACPGHPVCELGLQSLWCAYSHSMLVAIVGTPPRGTEKELLKAEKCAQQYKLLGTRGRGQIPPPPPPPAMNLPA